MIRNKTRQTVVCQKAEIARGFWKKASGLMLRPRLEEGSGLLMVWPQEARRGIWMLLMRFPIDVVFLDSEKRIVDIREHVQPIGLAPSTWRIYYPQKPAQYVLELPAGRVGETRSRIGDVVEF